MEITILSIGLLVFVGHFLTGFFERTKVPDVLVLMQLAPEPTGDEPLPTNRDGSRVPPEEADTPADPDTV